MSEWTHVRVEHVMDEQAKTLCPHHSIAQARRTLAREAADYIPVVDPTTYQLVGILSATDLVRTGLPSRSSTAPSPLS